MNNSFIYLCLHLLLFIFLDAVALKLIPGDRSVVKKDGATHTISRYYVVPKDFDADNVNGNDTVTSAVTSNSRYAKSMDSDVNGTLEVDVTSEDLKEDPVPVNSKRANSDGTYTLDDIDIRIKPVHNDLVSFSHQLGLGQASANQALGNIEVAPINTPIFENFIINNSITNNINEEFSDDEIETVINTDEEENKFVSTDLRVLFDESAELNTDNFWRLFNIYVNKANQNEHLERIEKLFVLVNIFTDLYKATKVNIPIDNKIDDMVRILQYGNNDSDIIKNRDGFQVNTLAQNVQENNYKLSTESNQDVAKTICQCRRKCQSRMMIDDLDSTSVSVSETDGRTDINQETNLQRRESNSEDVNVWVKMPPSYPGKNNQPIKIKKRLLVNPSNQIQTGKTIRGLPGYKVMSLSKPNEAHIGRENGIYEDINLNLDIIDTAEMNKQPFVVEEKSRIGLPLVAEEKKINDGNPNLPFIEGNQNTDSSYQPVTIEARQTASPPFTIEDRLSINKDPHPPFVLEDRQNFNQDFVIEDRQNANLPWVIEDRQNMNKDFIIEDRQNANLPWVIEDRQNMNKDFIIEDRQNANLPWVIEDRQNMNKDFIIEDRQNANLPWVIEDRQNMNKEFIIEDRQNANLPWVIEDRQNMNKEFIIQDRERNSPFIFKERIRGRPGLDIKSSLVKPHVYHTYIINPTKILYGQPKVHNDLLKILSGKYKNQEGIEYDISSTREKPRVSKYMLIKKPSGSYYESEISVSNGKQPSILLNKPGYRESHVNIEREIDVPGYDTDVDGSQTFLRPGGLPNGYESNIEVEYEEESDINPLLHSYQPSYETNFNLEVQKEYSRPLLEEVSAGSEIFYNNRPLTGQETKLHIDLERNTAPMYTDTEIAGNYETVFPTQPFNTYEKELQLEIGGNTEYQPLPVVRPIPSIHKSSYVNLQNSPVAGFNGYTDVNSEVYLNQPQVLDLQYNKNPNHISYYEHKQQVPAYNYVERLRAQLAPSYKLFSIDNLLRLQDALIKRRQFNKLSVYEERALANLNRINTILLTLAETSGSNDLSKIWYENIFFNGGNIHKHPLQLYVYNLLRQKWLHEIMLMLHNNNFNLNILNNPRLFSFLGTWQFPNNVLKYLETSNIVIGQQQKPHIFEENFGAHNVLHDSFKAHSIIEEDAFEPQEIIGSEILDNYVTENEGLILSITGLDVGLDANAIIDILKKYLVYQNYVEKQESAANRGNKIEMFKQIVVFLREKGYDNGTILDLIHKLYKAVYRVEGKGCSRNQVNDFVQNAYDVIVPVLRRSGQ